jgi:hypothetical protein
LDLWLKIWHWERLLSLYSDVHILFIPFIYLSEHTHM